MRTPDVSPQQRRSALHNAFGNCATIIPILIFQVLLADKLDKDLDWPFILVASPLLLALFTLILLSFNAKGGNKWWFGIRKSFSQFLLSVIPCLQEYGNISYNADNADTNVQLEEFEKFDKKSKKALSKKSDNMKPVVPIISIDIPD